MIGSLLRWTYRTQGPRVCELMVGDGHRLVIVRTRAVLRLVHLGGGCCMEVRLILVDLLVCLYVCSCLFVCLVGGYQASMVRYS